MIQTVSLSDICTKITSGGTPLTKRDDYYGGGIPWLRTQEVNFGNIYSTEKTITELGLKNSSAKIIPEDSVIVAMYGATAGKSAINKIPLATNQACCNLIIDNDKADYRFVYYYLVNSYEKLLSAAVGAAQQNLGSKQISAMTINLPSLDQQKKIANILGSLDEKIELNHRMNETLEQLGQALFRHYFVDNPEAKNWDDVKVGELVDIKGGGTPSTKNSSFWGGDIVWSSPRDLANQRCHFLMRTDKTITKQGLLKISSGMLPAGTLLLSSRAPIGYIAFAGVDMAINQGYIAFLPKAKLSNYFMYFWLKNNIQKIKDSANGSTFLEISKTAFRNIYIKQPNQLLHNKFQYEAMIILDKIRDNEAEIYNLTSLRDSLLPKLISGEIKI